MIATHNIKVNGRWVRAGESYETEAREPEKAEQEVPAAASAEDAQPVEEKKTEAKPRTASTRRKNTSK